MSYEIKYTNEVVGLDLEDRAREMHRLLSVHNCEVTFTKVNGELRTMPCTLRQIVIPQPVTESTKTKKHNPEVMSVWCLDKKEWRSFRIANVTEIKVIPNE
jgi:hypothetical protein